MLANVVLSVAVNTATCERVFSEWGIIHTARRNRLAVEKVKQIGIVRTNVRAKGEKSKETGDEVVVDRIISPNERRREISARAQARQVRDILRHSGLVLGPLGCDTSQKFC